MAIDELARASNTKDVPVGRAAATVFAPIRDERRGDVLAIGSYLVGAMLVLARLWADPNGRVLRDNRQDQVFFEWVLTNAARTLRHLGNPFFTDHLNAPHGVNLMANTSIWGLALPLVPLTSVLGAPVAVLVLLTGALFGTAAAWYHVLSRHVVRSGAAAYIGGAFCGFAPGMISQATGHPNLVAQFLLPFIALAVIRLREPGPVVRRGLFLAALVCAQAFINEELLFFTALALALFVLVYALARWSEVASAARGALATLGVAAVAAGAVLAYPLSVQFAGRQSYHGLPDWVLAFRADLATYPAYAGHSLAGPSQAAKLAAATEQNAFFGWSLLALTVIMVAWLWRRPAARALAITGLAFAMFSLGTHITVNGRDTGVPGPWRLLARLPLFDSVVPTRLSLVVIPLLGILIALFVDAVLAREPGPAATPVARDSAIAGATPGRLALLAAVLVALVPILPVPLATAPRPATPKYFAAGLWRHYIHPGDTVVILPLGWYADLDAMQWQTATGQEFRIVNGYFLAPDPASPQRRARFGPPDSAARRLFGESVAQPAPLTELQQLAVLADLHRWKADVLLLPDSAGNADVLRPRVQQVLGEGWHIGDVWVWDVRALTPR